MYCIFLFVESNRFDSKNNHVAHSVGGLNLKPMLKTLNFIFRLSKCLTKFGLMLSNVIM